MNLVTDAWLPVTNSKNQLCYIGLKQLFEQPDEWLDLVLRPHERVSVKRFLICLVQAALDGPEGIDDWNEAIEEIPQAGLNYLAKWKKVFNLYDDKKPFLQVSKLQSGNSKNTGPSITKLDSTLVVGENESTLFDHGATSPCERKHVERKMTDSQLTISLITFQNFSPSGTQSSAKLAGKLIAHNSGATDAPSVNQNMLHTFVIKDDLIKTIHANLIDKETTEDFYGKDSWGKPVWEADEPISMDDNNAYNNSVNTYLGRLVPLSRFCKLTKGSVYFIYCKGFEYSAKPKKKTDSKRVYRDFLPEPSSTVLVNSKGEYTLLKSGVNTPWREIPALIAKRHRNSNGGALSLQYLNPVEKFGLLVVGQVRDPENVAKVLDLVESRIYVPTFMLGSAKQQVYESNIRNCEKKSYLLFKSIEKYRTTVDNNWKGIVKRVVEGGTSKSDRKNRNIFRKNATNHFWTLVEKKRHLLMYYISLLETEKDHEREEAKKAWLNAVNQSARETYQTLCSQESPRQVQAYVTGWQMLYPSRSKKKETI